MLAKISWGLCLAVSFDCKYPKITVVILILNHMYDEDDAVGVDENRRQRCWIKKRGKINGNGKSRRDVHRRKVTHVWIVIACYSVISRRLLVECVGHAVDVNEVGAPANRSFRSSPEHRARESAAERNIHLAELENHSKTNSTRIFLLKNTILHSAKSIHLAISPHTDTSCHTYSFVERFDVVPIHNSLSNTNEKRNRRIVDGFRSGICLPGRGCTSTPFHLLNESHVGTIDTRNQFNGTYLFNANFLHQYRDTMHFFLNETKMPTEHRRTGLAREMAVRLRSTKSKCVTKIMNSFSVCTTRLSAWNQIGYRRFYPSISRTCESLN